jgi:hypothetical protein
MVTRVQTEMTDKPTLMIASGANTATGATACHRVAGERIEEIAIPVVKAVSHRELQSAMTTRPTVKGHAIIADLPHQNPRALDQNRTSRARSE